MCKLILILLIIFITAGESFAYAVKVYDEYGNRVGTYRKVGDGYEFYDFYDRKVEKAEDIIKNAPTQKVLSETEPRIYNSDLLPLDAYNFPIYGTEWRYHTRRYVRPHFVNMPRGRYIVRPRRQPLGSPSISQPAHPHICPYVVPR